MLCVLSLSANQMQESQAKFPENKEYMLSGYLRKVTSYQLLITLNFSARGGARVLFLKEGTNSMIFHSLNCAPFTLYIKFKVSAMVAVRARKGEFSTLSCDACMKILTRPQPTVLQTAEKILVIPAQGVTNTGRILKDIAIDTQLVSTQQIRTIFSQACPLNQY